MKQYRFLKPEVFGLDGEYIANETKNGYCMNITPDHWFGLPKSVVENCNAFEYVGEIKKRPRISAKKVI